MFDLFLDVLNTDGNDPTLEAKIRKVDTYLTVYFPVVYQKLLSVGSQQIAKELQKGAIAFMVANVLFYLILLLAFFLSIYRVGNEMRNRVILSIRLLRMIPPQVIANIPSIRNYLNQLSL